MNLIHTTAKVWVITSSIHIIMLDIVTILVIHIELVPNKAATIASTELEELLTDIVVRYRFIGGIKSMPRL